jgi:NAD(P)-dependent dehydrogenase (short-subunit alcohol dehydrogenase family)
MSQEDFPTTPSFALDGRRALVTGAGRGLGAACALALAGAGAVVTLVSRTAHEIEAVAGEIRRRGGFAETLTLDVNDIARFAEAVHQAEPFEILVNNAGTNRPAAFVDVRPDDYDAVFGLNVRAAFFAAQAVARKLIEAGRKGSIINMSSQMGHVGGPNRSVYCATKHAIEGLTKVMAGELGPKGIRVNSICPTFIETPMTAPFLANPDFRTFALSKIKLGRLGRVEDVMGGVVFLASEASALMTGSALMIDAGWTSS